MNLTINVDMDSVIYDFHTPMGAAIERAGLVPDLTKWNMGIERHDFERIFHAQIREGLFADSTPISGAIGSIRLLEHQGHRVRIVTAKTFKNADPMLTMHARQDAIQWLTLHGLGHLELSFTGGTHGKHGYVADVVIDDKPVLTDWIQQRALNILFDQPWNEDVVFPPGYQMRVAYGWDDAMRLIVNESREKEKRYA